MKLSVDSYLAGIEKAREAGLISYARPEYTPLGPIDGYSIFPKGYEGEYVGNIWGTNTREALPATRQIIRLMASVRERVRVLDLGIGLARTLYQAHNDVLACGATPHCTGLSLTPVNPYWALKLTWKQIRNLAREQGLITREERNDGFSLEQLCQWQNEAKIEAFDVTEDPWIDHQLIAAYPDDKWDLPTKGFDIIIDQQGYYYYCSTRSPENWLALNRCTLPLLADDGCIVVAPGNKLGLMYGPADSCGYWRTGNGSPDWQASEILFGPDNPILAKLKSREGVEELREVKMMHSGEVIQELSRLTVLSGIGEPLDVLRELSLING